MEAWSRSGGKVKESSKDEGMEVKRVRKKNGKEMFVCTYGVLKRDKRGRDAL